MNGPSRIEGRPRGAVHVGVGGRGRTHVLNFSNHPRWEPLALVDNDVGALQAAATITGLTEVQCFTDLSEAFGTIHADAAVVASPSEFHREHVGLALDAGLHVFVEKPFTQRLTDAIELVRLAEARDRRITVCQQYRYGRDERAIQDALASGLVGRPRYGTLIHHRHRPDVLRFTMPHALITEMSVHHFDTLRWWLDADADTIIARSFDPPWSRYDGGAASALISFAGGAEIAYLATFVSSNDQFQLRLECDAGVVGFDAEGPFMLIDGTCRRLPQSVGRTADECVIDSFTEAIDHGLDDHLSGRSNLATMAMIDAATRSASTGLPARCWPAQEVALEAAR